MGFWWNRVDQVRKNEMGANKVGSERGGTVALKHEVKSLSSWLALDWEEVAVVPL